MRKELYWHNMANDVCPTVCSCHSCAKNCTHSIRRRRSGHFSRKGPLEDISTEVMSPYQNTNQGSQFLVVMTDLCTKLSNPILVSKSNATTVARIFLEHWVENFGILWRLLNDSVLEFVSKFFFAVSSTFGEWYLHHRVPPTNLWLRGTF